MPIYLPIAELSVDGLVVLLLGGVTGILAGMMGLGGGFLITPLLMFLGIPPAVAVASSANQMIASSVSGFYVQWRKANVDFQIGGLMLVGGLLGSFLGVWLFAVLKKVGQIDLVISLTYVGLLGVIGALMAFESGRAIYHKRNNIKPRASRLAHMRRWQKKLPLQKHFTRSNIEVSVLIPVALGFMVGILVSLTGVGGGFFMIPAMIYILGMPASVIVGTSLFQVIFVTANVTLLHSITTQTVDVILALLLLSGSVIGTQVGLRLGTKLPSEYVRAIMAGLVLIVALRLGYGLIVAPDELYSVTIINPS